MQFSRRCEGCHKDVMWEDCHQEGVTDDRKCDSPKRGVKGIREVRQLTERCDGYEGGVRRCGRCDSCQEV